MKKQHDAASLANELEGSSAFFREREAASPTSTELPAPEERPVSRPTTRPPDGSTNASGDRRAEPSTHPPRGRAGDGATDRPLPRAMPRKLQRRSFEFYLDQLETLKAWSLEAQLRGEKGSMSEVIRAALDRYLRDEATFHPSTDAPTTRPADASVGEPEE